MGQNQVVRLFASLPTPRSAIIVYCSCHLPRYFVYVVVMAVVLFSVVFNHNTLLPLHYRCKELMSALYR